MAELVLSVIGVVPVLVGCIKAIEVLSTLVKTARRCIKELDDLNLDLETQRVLFLNECALLLQQAGEDGPVSKSMAADPSHANWENSGTLDYRIQQSLGHSYELRKKIFSRIQEISEEAIDHLQDFEVVRSQKVKVSYDVPIARTNLLLTSLDRVSRGKSHTKGSVDQ
jgi:hypothetical protein